MVLWLWENRTDHWNSEAGIYSVTVDLHWAVTLNFVVGIPSVNSLKNLYTSLIFKNTFSSNIHLYYS